MSAREYVVPGPPRMGVSFARYVSVSTQRPSVMVYSLILTTVREVVVALGLTSPETVNGSPMTGVAESLGLLTLPAALACARAGSPPTIARTMVISTTILSRFDICSSSSVAP